MASLGKIDKGILASFFLLLGLVGIIGGLYLQQYIYAIVLGSIFQIGLNGTLPVTADTLTFMNETEDSFFQVLGTVNTSAVFAGTLITIGVILLVFGGFLLMGHQQFKKFRKGGKGGSGGDMGY